METVASMQGIAEFLSFGSAVRVKPQMADIIKTSAELLGFIIVDFEELTNPHPSDVVLLSIAREVEDEEVERLLEKKRVLIRGGKCIKIDPAQIRVMVIDYD